MSVILNQWLEYYPEEIDEDGDVVPARELFCLKALMARSEWETVVAYLGQTPFTTVSHGWDVRTKTGLESADIIHFNYKTEDPDIFFHLGGTIPACEGYVEWHRRKHEKITASPEVVGK